MVNYEDFWKKMTGFNYLFGKAESNITEYKGETIYAVYKYDLKGRHTIKFKLIKSNPNTERGLHFFVNKFRGKIYDHNGKRIAKPKGVYASLMLTENVWKKNKNNEFVLIIDLEDGYINIENGLYKDDCQAFSVSSFWGAMKFEKISSNIFRFYCNDTELEDDFDDLIFEMEILD